MDCLASDGIERHAAYRPADALFQGEDGRTTIFDYWGVPEFQQWVNDGQFNEALLTTEQKTLRQFYGNLNAFVLENEAIYAGGF